jgi:hypothetical protein
LVRYLVEVVANNRERYSLISHFAFYPISPLMKLNRKPLSSGIVAPTCSIVPASWEHAWSFIGRVDSARTRGIDGTMQFALRQMAEDMRLKMMNPVHQQ